MIIVGVTFYYNTNDSYKGLNLDNLQRYYEKVKQNIKEGKELPEDSYCATIIYEIDRNLENQQNHQVSKSIFSLGENEEIEHFTFSLIKQTSQEKKFAESETRQKIIEYRSQLGKNLTCIVEIEYNDNYYSVLTVYTDETLIAKTRYRSLLTVEGVLFSSGILIIMITFLWNQISVARRINLLTNNTDKLYQLGFKNDVKIKGTDEIAKLSKVIDKLRLDVLNNETEKKKFLQNISHDIKNPISIISSYIEAVEDGIAGVDEIEIVRKQTDLLTKRVTQLITYVKQEYNSLEQDKKLEELEIIPILKELVKDNKIRFTGEFIIDGDNSKYIIEKDSFEIAIQNIIDNAIRYAKSKIVIRVKKGILTISNDGEQIADDFIDSVFTPYEKSIKGQFGLGMSITRDTLLRFNLTISCFNDNQMVTFKIEPIKK